jgi:translation elongation factor EF-1beta
MAEVVIKIPKDSEKDVEELSNEVNDDLSARYEKLFCK